MTSAAEFFSMQVVAGAGQETLAADFQVSQVVDRTTGVHGVIQKSHFTG